MHCNPKRYFIMFPIVILLASCFFSILLVRASGDAWVTMAPMPEANMTFGVAVVNDKIYVIGGWHSNGISASACVYDSNTGTWTTRASMPFPRSDFAIAVYQNKIYVIGGDNGTGSQGFPTVTGANEVYDPVTDTWKALAPMPTIIASLRANVVGSKIYVIGGGSSLNQVYDPTTDSWTTDAPIPVTVADYASAVLDNKIYILGGEPSNAIATNLNQIYDTATDSWSVGKPLPVPVTDAAAGVTTGVLAPVRIFVLGGRAENYGTSFNQIYDPENDTWASGTSMPTARYVLAVAVVNDALYALGGAYEPGYAPPVPLYATNELYIPEGYLGSIPTPYVPTPSPPATSQPPTSQPTQTPSPSPSPLATQQTMQSPQLGSSAFPMWALYATAVTIAAILIVGAAIAVVRKTTRK